MLWAFIITYSVVFLVLFRYSWKSSNGREKSLSYLFVMNLAIFYLVLIAIQFGTTFTPNFRDFLTVYGLATIGVFVGTIEVPGFLILSRYDENSTKILKEIRHNLIISISSFSSSIQELEQLVTENKSRCKELQLYELLNYFLQSSKQMNQVNRSVFDLLLLEINRSIGSVSRDSKHPFPKLIDVLSLTGLSFLIAQLIR
jgi:hypothetical protein